MKISKSDLLKLIAELHKTSNKLKFIYIIREREFVQLNKNIYKIGFTTQSVLGRMETYPKATEIILAVPVNNYIIETCLKKRLKKKFTQEPQYGDEYFSGDANEIASFVYKNINKMLYEPLIDDDIDNDSFDDFITNNIKDFIRIDGLEMESWRED